MKYPLIINPIENLPFDVDLLNQKATEIYFAEFQKTYREDKNVPVLQNFPISPIPTFKFLERFKNLEFELLAIIGLLLLYWLVIPIIFILLIVDIVVYFSELIINRTEISTYKKLISSIQKNNYQYQQFIKFESDQFQDYISSANSGSY